MLVKRMYQTITIMILTVAAFVLGSPFHAQAKTYEIGTDITFAPFEFQNDAGEYVGIDIDLLKEISKSQDFEMELNPLGFDSSIQAVQSGQVDAMIAGMSITEERKQSFDFSDSYFDSGIQMAVKSGNETIKSLEDLKGKTVAAKVGTESANYIEKNQEKYGFSVKNFDDATGLYSALANGEADAIYDDYPVLGYAINQGQELSFVGEKITGSSYGFAVKKGENQELLEKFNQGLKELKENGKYDEILATYITASAQTSGETMKKVTPKKETYIIASDSTYAPFEFQKENGEYAGIDVDLMQRIADMQGFNIEMQYLGFNSAIQAVEAGQADGVIAGMSITDERKQKYDFSEGYFQGGIQIAVAEDNTDIASYDDLKGKTVGAKLGTASASFLEENQDKYGYKIKQLETTDALHSALEIGAIDAFMDDYPVTDYSINQGKKIKTPIQREDGGVYAFAVKKGSNPELVEMFNEGLNELKRTGEYDDILSAYLGTNESNSSDSKVDESTFIGIVKNNWKRLLNGLGMTILLTAISFALALVIGVILGLFSVSPSAILRGIATVFVDIIRGIPLMVLAFFIYFGLPGVLGMKIPVFVAGIITLTLNASAYISEIVRGGINAVAKGQTEASRSLGLSYAQTMRLVVLPQAIKVMLPSFVNQFVISLKDTTILSAIGLIELLQAGKIIVARNLQATLVYLLIALIYFVVITALTKLAKLIEKKVN